MKNFWDERYSGNDTVYGHEPNLYFKKFIDSHTPGKLLLPAEGEGRNAIYAALKGWQVDAFDYSSVAKEKALQLAAEKQVHINYTVMEADDYKAAEKYDAIALIYAHQPPATREKLHAKLVESLKPGGFIVVEVFNPAQLNYNSGGPKDVSMLYTVEMLEDDFKGLKVVEKEETIIQLDEGEFHKGQAYVTRFIAQL